MTESPLTRQYTRANFSANVLFVDGDFVLKAKGHNVSEGGILLRDVPHIPEINAVPLLFMLPELKYLGDLNFQETTQFYSSLQGKSSRLWQVVKVKSRLVRSFHKDALAMGALSKHIAYEFVAFQQPARDLALIQAYVALFTKNIVYLLSLFEHAHKSVEQLEHLKCVAKILGYDHQMKISLLRAKVLHDYQSL